MAFAARRVDLLAGAVDEANAAGPGVAHALALDVTNTDSIADSVTAAATTMGGLDGVLYTAGMSPIARLSTVTPEQWHTILAINTVGPSMVFAAALKHISPDGIMAAISSDSSHQPRHSLVPYAASKAALEATMEGWRTEEIGGLRFMTVMIGPTGPSGFADNFSPDEFMGLIPHWQRQGFRTGMQTSDDVGNHLASAFASLFDAPLLGIETLLLRAPEPALAVADFGGSEVFGS